MRPLSNPSPLLLALLTLALAGGCSTSSSNQAVAPAPSPVASTAAPSPTTSPSPALNATQLLTEATDYAAQATSLAQSAQSRDDWTLVSNRWERAIALLDQIPDNAPEASKAQQNLANYRRNLAQAQQLANRPLNQGPVRLNRPDEPAQPAEGADPAATPSPGASPTETAEVSAEVALANHLRQSGARMYGTYWCSYCRRQQEMFGPEAVQQLEIVECDPRGTNPQTQRCRDAQVGSFPTWEINGQLYPGLQSLANLADLSNYTGPRTFRN